MGAVFISYSRKDFYFAESLAFHLDREGIRTWLDPNHLAPGVRRKRMAHRSCRHLRARPAISSSLANFAHSLLVPCTTSTRHEVRVTPEHPAKMGRADLDLALHGTLDVAPWCIGVKYLLSFRAQDST